MRVPSSGRGRQSRKCRRCASRRYGVRPSRGGVTCKTDQRRKCLYRCRPVICVRRSRASAPEPPQFSPVTLPPRLCGGAPPRIGGARLVQGAFFPSVRLKILTFFCSATKSPGSGARSRTRIAPVFPLDKNYYYYIIRLLDIIILRGLYHVKF